MKKRTDWIDWCLNCGILLFVGVLVDRYSFETAQGNTLLLKEETAKSDLALNKPSTDAKTLLKEEPQEPISLAMIEYVHREHLSLKRNRILIHKQQHHLYLIDQEGHEIGPFPIAIGKNSDLLPKEKEGDQRTPEGEYYLTTVMDESQPLLQRFNRSHLSALQGHHKFGKPQEDLGTNSYGPYFLMLNYPNAQDRKLGRSGSGIGIHGTNDPDSLGQEATSGCIRMKNEDLTWLAQWITAGTPVQINKNKLPPQ
ncbi:MAG: L,D-transpeptidase [Planctomycetota bacterium]